MEEALGALEEARRLHAAALERVDAAIVSLREGLARRGCAAPRTGAADASLELSVASRAYLLRHNLLPGAGDAARGGGGASADAGRVLDADEIRRLPKLS